MFMFTSVRSFSRGEKRVTGVLLRCRGVRRGAESRVILKEPVSKK